VSFRTPFFASLGALAVAALAPPASGAEPTPGYPEAVIQWGVQKGETCETIAKALYGSDKNVPLLFRYNRVRCNKGTPLPEGLTLVLPEKVTTVPDARLRSLNPDVRARPSGSGWAAAASGMPLFSNYNVNTLDAGRADIEFADRTRVFLAPNTLVVIYGTANQTKVSKTQPAAVEVQSGEVKAGLAALRGGDVEVAVQGGGRVTAASRDTVVQRTGKRTTVSVFDGKASVKNGGKSVEVKKNFATRFVDQAPPDPPRPVPPAPVWASGGSDGAELAPNGEGRISAAWNAVPTAAHYRFEVARDDAFREILVREEVPGDVHSFRAEKMPPGTYYLDVRVIDKDDYLGAASTPRLVRLVDAQIESGEGLMSARSIDANPYGTLGFGASPNVELSFDEGAFAPLPPSLDLRKHPTRSLRLRIRGREGVTVVPIEYSKVTAKVEPKRSADGRVVEVRAQVDGLEGIDVKNHVTPTLRVHLPDGVRTAPMSVAPDGVLTGSLALAGFAGSKDPALDGTRVDVVDVYGTLLGTASVDLADRTPPPPPTPPPVYPQIGALAPLWQLGNVTDMLWQAPTLPDVAVVSGGGRSSEGTVGVQGQVRASGTVGPFGIDAAIRSGATNDRNAGDSAWLGGRYRVYRLGLSELEVAPVLRVGIPVAADGPPTRLEPSLAVGGARGRWTWLVDAGGRFRLADDEGAGGAPPTQAFVLFGGTADFNAWARAHAVFDVSLLNPDTGPHEGRAGVSLGLEAGRTVFGGAEFRLSPWDDPGVGVFSAQLALGVRAK
jgi:hypothetical protein